MKEELQNSAKEPASISMLAHDNAMYHKDNDNRRMMIVCLALCATLIIVVVTLVAYYTSRTAMWNETIAKLYSALVEVANVKGITPP